MGKNGKAVFGALGGLLAVLFLGFVWPSLWVYGSTATDLYRVNRFTGTKQWATDFGWLTADQHMAAIEQRRFDWLGKRARKVFDDVRAGKIASAHQDNQRLRVSYTSGESEIFYGDDMEKVAEALSRAGLRDYVVER